MHTELVEPGEHIDVLEVAKGSVTLATTVKSGQFGDVCLGKLPNTGDVNVIMLKQNQMKTEDILTMLKLIHHLRHNKVVKLLAVCTKSEPIWMITELMIYGELLHFLRRDKGKNVQFNDLVNMAGQIAEGMAYLELEHVIHNDLRAFNIFLGDDNIVKIGNFFLARMNEGVEYEMSGDTKLPLKWTAPEAVFDRKFSIKSDVWSYGVLLYDLTTFGNVPYPGMKGKEVLDRVEKGFRMQKPTDGPKPCPEPYYKIMLQCWNRVPECRPTFEYLKDFFSNYMVNVEEKYLTLED